MWGSEEKMQKPHPSINLHRGRPKSLNGPVQNVNFHLETSVCRLIEAAVKNSHGRYKCRSDFIRNAITQALTK